MFSLKNEIKIFRVDHPYLLRNMKSSLRPILRPIKCAHKIS